MEGVQPLTFTRVPVASGSVGKIEKRYILSMEDKVNSIVTCGGLPGLSVGTLVSGMIIQLVGWRHYGLLPFWAVIGWIGDWQ